jgi:hypothetical protein
MPSLDGACLCGQVTYSCEADPLATAVCHCTECQRQTGTSFSIVVAVPRDAFRAQGGTLSSYTTVGTDSGMEVERQFCSGCGSPIASVPAAGPMVFIKAGTLNDRSWLQPQLAVWCDSAQPWVPVESLAQTTMPRGIPAG